VLEAQRTRPEIELNALRMPLVYRAQMIVQRLSGVREPAALSHHLDEGTADRQLRLATHFVRVTLLGQARNKKIFL
jgi:hypothetical protein